MRIKEVITIMGFLFLAACTTVVSNGQPKAGSEELKDDDSGWRDIQLKDVRTGETFTVSQFEEKPVLLESFAVWCPTCKKQQDKIKELHEEVGDSVVSISLDTDPNEDESKVRDHVNRNGFDWYYAVSPAEMTRELIDQFGVRFVNAPSAPVVLICDGEAHFLDSGVKDIDELKDAIAGCA